MTYAIVAAAADRSVWTTTGSRRRFTDRTRDAVHSRTSRILGRTPSKSIQVCRAAIEDRNCPQGCLDCWRRSKGDGGGTVMANSQGIEVLTRAHDYLPRWSPRCRGGLGSADAVQRVDGPAGPQPRPDRPAGLRLRVHRWPPGSDPFDPEDALDADPAADSTRCCAGGGHVCRPARRRRAGADAARPAAPPVRGRGGRHGRGRARLGHRGRDRPGPAAVRGAGEGIWPVADRLVDQLRDSDRVFAPALERRKATTGPKRSSPSWAATRTGRPRAPHTGEGPQCRRLSSRGRCGEQGGQRTRRRRARRPSDPPERADACPAHRQHRPPPTRTVRAIGLSG